MCLKERFPWVDTHQNEIRPDNYEFTYFLSNVVQVPRVSLKHVKKEV
jgi:hypothetical protein